MASGVFAASAQLPWPTITVLAAALTQRGGDRTLPPSPTTMLWTYAADPPLATAGDATTTAPLIAISAAHAAPAAILILLPDIEHESRRASGQSRLVAHRIAGLHVKHVAPWRQRRRQQIGEQAIAGDRKRLARAARRLQEAALHAFIGKATALVLATQLQADRGHRAVREDLAIQQARALAMGIDVAIQRRRDLRHQRVGAFVGRRHGDVPDRVHRSLRPAGAVIAVVDADRERV